ncbi:PREDICTED: pentatricopeptide repeat-containing protein At3g22690-like isoform X1 [Tarenaya hassleriana]|uniref:pentatricopeptide repeat-containing protein At3g22690-like isoform X1 n=1 Tax=Tarenaya hassleriana TaxID=28532 RepID=UPI00053C8C5E|nr:PREDICTED: pentatricopeptide repeat-containing protein At3g22690-like isoform X1 [Tarenaya hassleriana]
MKRCVSVPKFPGKIFSGKWHRRKFFTGDENRSGNRTDIVATNIAITERVKLGRLDVARNLFDEMSQRTAVSWNAMLSGYSRWGQYEEALDLVRMMHLDGVRFTDTTFSCTLSLCANSRSSHFGKQVHGLVLKSGSESFGFVGSSLLYFYANCFRIADAERVFDELYQKNELLWDVMLVGYVKWYLKNERDSGRALHLFRKMRETGEVHPNEFSFDSVIRACGRLGNLQEGRIVHALLLKYGFESDDMVGAALIEFYCECEAIDGAKCVYRFMDNPSLKASNSLLHSLITKELFGDAEKIFDSLHDVNAVTCNLMIKGYALQGRTDDSIKLFEKMPCKSIISSNTMISIYFRNNEIDKAIKLFKETMEERNSATWNAVISGYTQNKKYDEALEVFVEMLKRSVERTRSTFSVLLHSCSCLSCLLQGQVIHGHIAKTPLESNVYVGTSLIDMYSKCGSITDARKSFTAISSANVAAWTALINGYSQHGIHSRAISLFNSMLEQRIQPNSATLTAVLSSCVHSGLVHEGLRLFLSMEETYRVKPSVEHYACVVNLLGRAGLLKEAADFVEQMPIEPDEVIYGALINACWLWQHTRTAKRVAEKILNLEPKTASANVVLSNMSADSSNWEEKMNMRKRLVCSDMKKDPGLSWIELNGKVHVFSAGDSHHLHSDLIYRTIDHLTANFETFLNRAESGYALVTYPVYRLHSGSDLV